MKRTARAMLAAVLALAAVPAFGQAPRTSLFGSAFRANLTAEYLTRRVSWDEETRDSGLKVLLAGLKFDVDGRMVEAMQLRPGMKLTATKVVEAPRTEVAQDAVVMGTTKK